MFSGLKEWLVNWLIKGKLTSWFNACTLPGKKRILGIVIFALATAAQMFPEVHSVLDIVISMLTQLGPEQYQEVGVVTFAVGLIHWLIRKYISGKAVEAVSK